MSPIDTHHVQAFHQARIAGFPGREEDFPMFDERLANRLSWMRNKCPTAFRHLCETDTQCASIAVQRKWAFRVDDDSQLGWGDRTAVAASIRKARAMAPTNEATSIRLVSCLKAALERYAPENLDLLE